MQLGNEEKAVDTMMEEDVVGHLMEIIKEYRDYSFHLVVFCKALARLLISVPASAQLLILCL